MDKNFLREKFTQYYLARRSEEFIKTFNSQRSWLHIQNKISARKYKRRISLATVCSTAIAALVIIIFLLPGKMSESEFSPNLFSDQIKNRARLTTENGEIILLTDSTKCIDNSVAVKDFGEGSILVYTPTEISQNQKQTLEVPRGKNYRLELSDGTRVWLNAETCLTFPKIFGTQREVYLTGEAYFEVVNKPDTPFIVHARNSSIKVLGTHFCVSDYPERPLQAVLSEGSVRITSPTDSVILIPDQKAEISEEGRIEVSPVDASTYISWISGTYEFTDTPLEVVALQLERMYAVSVKFTKKQLKDVRLTGAICRNKSLGYSLNILERATNIRFLYNNQTITITQKE